MKAWWIGHGEDPCSLLTGVGVNQHLTAALHITYSSFLILAMDNRTYKYIVLWISKITIMISCHESWEYINCKYCMFRKSCPFYIETFYIKICKTSWTYSSNHYLIWEAPPYSANPQNNKINYWCDQFSFITLLDFFRPNGDPYPYGSNHTKQPCKLGCRGIYCAFR